MPFNYHTDASHGWLEVSLSECLANGLTPEDFSRFSYRGLFFPRFSYRSEETLFLEEDCDMPLFAKAYQKLHGQPIETRDLHNSTGEHFIQSLASLESMS